MSDITEVPGSQSAPVKLKVFISYSRQDMAMADGLVADLEAHGFGVMIDRRDLPFGEQWQKVLAEFIVAADAVVWLVSPRSVGSEWCQWELGEVARHGKRLVPIRITSFDNKDLPAAIGRVHILPVDGVYAREAQLPQLVAVLSTNREWLQEHTRLVAMATHWAQRDRPDDQLMSAADIRSTGEMLERRPRDAAEPPQVLVELRDKSREKLDAEDIKQRRIIGRGFVKPALAALRDGAIEHAIRLAAAGALLAKDIGFDLVPELWPPLVRAINGNRTELVLRAHTGGSVCYASFSPDGTRVLTASPNDTARLWDASTGSEIAAFEAQNGTVKAAWFSLCGMRVLSGSLSHTACIFDPATGKAIAVLRDSGWVHVASFSPDGRRVVTGSDDGTARVWDAATGRQIAIFEGHSSSVFAASFSPDGVRVVTGSNDRTARVWDATTGRQTAVFGAHALSVMASSFSPDGTRIVTGASDNTACVWDSTTSVEIARMIGHEDGTDPINHGITSVSFSPDGTRVVTGAFDNTARIWDAMTGAEIAVLRAHGDSVNVASFSPDGTRVVTGSNDGTVRVWNVWTSHEIAIVNTPARQLDVASFNSDGTCIATGIDRRTANLWDASSGVEIAVIALPYVDVDIVNQSTFYPKFSPDGTRAVVGGRGSAARVLDTSTASEIAVFTAHKNAVRAASFSPDSKAVVTGSFDSTARVWEASTGTEIAAFEVHAEAVYVASFSPDGQRVVTGSADNTARVWEASTGTEISAFEAHTGTVYATAFSPDGRRVVTGSGDGTARIWDASTGNEIDILPADHRDVLAVSFSPDGRRVVTGTDGGTARVWDVTRTEALSRGRAVVIAAALSRGLGNKTGSEATDLLMRDAPEDLFAEALRQLGRPADDPDLHMTIAVLRAPLHPNCYLSPTQFAEKFGIDRPAKAKADNIASNPAALLPGGSPTVARSKMAAAISPPSTRPHRNVPPSHQRLVLAAHGKSSPAIATWLAARDIVASLDTFDAADAQAARRQKRYLRTARRATILSTLATIIAALTLLPIEQALGLNQLRWIGLVQFLCVVVAFWSIMRISWSKLLTRWLRARAETETLRADLFRRLMHAPLPPTAQLSAFEECHLDYQRSFYEKRGGQLAKAAGGVAPLKLVGYSVLALSATVSAVLAADIAVQFAIGWGIQPWSWVRALAAAVPPEATRWQLGLGALASAALSFASAWTLINQDDRNASRYAATRAKLDAVIAEGRDAARSAAASDDRAAVLAFTDRVQAILDSEHSAWVAARPPDNPSAGPGPSLEKAV